MSVRVMSWVWEHSRASGAERLVLLAIADAARDDGMDAWPSIGTISRKANMDTRTAQRAIRRLVELGELAVTMNAGKGGSNLYRVIMSPRQVATPGETPPPGDTPPGEMPPRQSAPLASHPSPPGETPPPPRRDATRTVLEPSKNHPSSEPSRPDVDELCEHLADRIEANGSKRPTISKGWRDAARLMLDADGRTPEQVRKAIDWCQTDEFWRSNVLSMPKLRQKYDQLRLAAQRPTGPGKPAPPGQRVQDVYAALSQPRSIP